MIIGYFIYKVRRVTVNVLVFAFAATVPGYEKGGKPAKMVPIYFMDTPAGVNFLPVEYFET